MIKNFKITPSNLLSQRPTVKGPFELASINSGYKFWSIWIVMSIALCVNSHHGDTVLQEAIIIWTVDFHFHVWFAFVDSGSLDSVDFGDRNTGIYIRCYYDFVTLLWDFLLRVIPFNGHALV